MYKRIGVIVAMESELSMIRAIMEEVVDYKEGRWTFTKGRIGEKEIVLLLSGIGKVNASIATVKMIMEFAPDCVINSGVAGGIDPSISVGDTVVGVSTAYHDFDLAELSYLDPGFPQEISADSFLLEKFKEMEADHASLKFGVICTGDQFISSPDRLAAIHERIAGGMAVDMESNSIAHVCYEMEVPFVSVRIISDTPWADANTQQFLNFWEEAPLRSFQLFKRLLELI